jgi:pimeloyl-ACP methyl ester carboxylesterase
LIPENENDVRKLLGLAYANPPWVPEFALWQVREVMYSQNRPEQRALIDALIRDIDVLRARPDPTQPTLLIWGREDRVFPLAIGRRLQRRLAPRARLAIIDHTSHAPNIEQPERFNRLLVEFLRDP